MSAIVARIRHQFADGRPAKRAGLILLALAAFSVIGTSAWAYWTTIGHGTASATTGTLNAPGTPGGNGASGTVSLTWGASTVSGGGTIRYNVDRSSDSGLTWTAACGLSIGGTTALSCDDSPAAGSYLYRVTAVYQSWTASSNSALITVASAAPTSFAVSGQPSSATAGSAFSFVLTAKTASNTTATGYVGTVHFTSSDGQAALPANYTFVTGDNGVHVFASAAALKTAGAQTITATDTTTLSITGAASVVVSPGAISTVTVAPASGTQVAGTAFTQTVTAFDAYGNTKTNYTGTVHFASNDPLAVLPGNYTFIGSDNGAHAFSTVTLKTAGTAKTVTVNDTVTTSATGTASYTVNPGLATKLVFTTASVSGSKGTTANMGPITIQLQDNFSNPVVAPAGGTTVTLVSSTPANGAAIFGLTQNFAGTSITSVSIPATTSSTSFWFGYSKNANPIITVSSGSLAPASQTENGLP